jgi:hypothetical protein
VLISNKLNTCGSKGLSRNHFVRDEVAIALGRKTLFAAQCREFDEADVLGGGIARSFGV